MATILDAIAATGGLSNTTKMPCHSYNLSAFDCKMGSVLNKVEGSVCHKCYALRGNYRWPNVQKKIKARKQLIYGRNWVHSMALLINASKNDFFRWHDSGDIQSVRHLRQIVKVCELTPNVKHWLPTREYGFVTKYKNKYGEFPPNLIVRLSAHMVDGKPPLGFNEPVSTVHSKEKGIPAGAVGCEAYSNGGKCGDCRACWDKDVVWVSYPKH